MSQKHILIVDDEESILTVLEYSLKKVCPDYKVVTVTNGFAALDKLKGQPYDLVVTDYNMAEMDGLELMETIRYTQPDAKLIMITGYGNEILEAETQRMQAYRYLTKPLDINKFRQIVKAAIADNKTRQAEFIVWSEQKHQKVHQLLEDLRAEVRSQCIFLTDTGANVIVKTGDTDKFPIENIAPLLGGSIVTLLEAGRTMDGNTDAIHLAYREGKSDDLYALNIGQQHLLILAINRGPYSSRLGTVWYNARQTATTLLETLQKSEPAESKQPIDKDMGQAFDAELDKLFAGDDLC